MEFGGASYVLLYSPILDSVKNSLSTVKSPGIAKDELYATTDRSIGQDFAIIYNYQQLQYWYGTNTP